MKKPKLKSARINRVKNNNSNNDSSNNNDTDNDMQSKKKLYIYNINDKNELRRFGPLSCTRLSSKSHLDLISKFRLPVCVEFKCAKRRGKRDDFFSNAEHYPNDRPSLPPRYRLRTISQRTLPLTTQNSSTHISDCGILMGRTGTYRKYPHPWKNS